VAVAHLSMMLFLDKRSIDKYPQSYITTASTVLAGAFGICMQISLGAAFTQHLWHVLRKSARKVSTIESLFTLRTDLFGLFKWDVIQAAPMLIMLAVIIWSLLVATTFPPGALTVVFQSSTTSAIVPVLTVNTSFVKDFNNLSTTADASIALFAWDGSTTNITLGPP